MAYVALSTQFPFAVTTRTRQIGGGDRGNFSTLSVMRVVARQQSRHPVVVAQARFLANGPDAEHAISSIRSYLASFPFYDDPASGEALTEPQLAIRLQAAGKLANAAYHEWGFDCDDVAVLGAALGLAAGLRARFVAIRFPTPLDRFPALSHVFTEIAPSGTHRWHDLDTTAPAELDRRSVGMSRPVIVSL